MTTTPICSAPANAGYMDALRDLDEVNTLLGSVRRQAVHSILSQFAAKLQQTLQEYQVLHALDSAGVNTSAAAAAACVTPMSLSMTPPAPPYPGLENLSPADLLMKSETAKLLESAAWNHSPATLSSWSQPATPDQFSMLDAASFGLQTPSLAGSSSLMPSPSSVDAMLAPRTPQMLHNLPGSSALSDPFSAAFPAPVSSGVSLTSEDLASLGGMSFQDAFSGGAGGSCDEASSFIALTSCSWEQDVSRLKVYIPLRGVQDDMIRTHFARHSVEVTVYNLQGRNYVFRINPTYQPVQHEGCYAVASKTKKTVILTIKKLSSCSKDDRHWRDLRAPYALPG